MSYHRESWMMEKDEKLRTVPLLHMQGNALVKQRQFREAASRYKEAVLLLKTVQSRVSPNHQVRRRRAPSAGGRGRVLGAGSSWSRRRRAARISDVTWGIFRIIGTQTSRHALLVGGENDGFLNPRRVCVNIFRLTDD